MRALRIGKSRWSYWFYIQRKYLQVIIGKTSFCFSQKRMRWMSAISCFDLKSTTLVLYELVRLASSTTYVSAAGFVLLSYHMCESCTLKTLKKTIAVLLQANVICCFWLLHTKITWGNPRSTYLIFVNFSTVPHNWDQ